MQTRIRSASANCEVAIIGAGPYGLSAGVHLKSKGIETCVFGEPMEFWARKMPEGMLLRSPRVASSLSDPDGAFTLEAYEAASKKEPCAPVPLDTFVEYGRWFRHQLGSDLDQRTVRRIDRDQPGFRLTLQDGTEIRSSSVVIAAGIGPFRKKPTVFQNLSPQQAIHCYEGREVRRFAGKRVAVIGAGQSALESAALLHEAGAKVEVIARQAEFRWIGQHSWLHHMGPLTSMLYSSHDVGPLGISRLVAYPKLVSSCSIGHSRQDQKKSCTGRRLSMASAALGKCKDDAQYQRFRSQNHWGRGCPQTRRRQRTSCRPCRAWNRI